MIVLLPKTLFEYTRKIIVEHKSKKNTREQRSSVSPDSNFPIAFLLS